MPHRSGSKLPFSKPASHVSCRSTTGGVNSLREKTSIFKRCFCTVVLCSFVLGEPSFASRLSLTGCPRPRLRWHSIVIVFIKYKSLQTLAFEDRTSPVSPVFQPNGLGNV